MPLDPVMFDAATIHASLSRAGLSVPAEEATEQVIGSGTRVALRALQERFGVEPSGVVDAETAAALETTDKAAAAPERAVHGRVFLTDGRPAANLAVRMVS